MKKQLNIMIVGVGGQGTLFSSRLLGRAAIESGYDVKVSEVHGMSQRGGSVVTYVRCADEVASPIITVGEADIILAFEQMEAARWLPYLKKGGTVIINTQKIDCMPVIIGAAKYPENIIETIKGLGVNVIALDALSIAEELGNAKSVNVVLIGVMARLTDGISKETWHSAVRATSKEKFADVNIKAFEAGYGF